MVEEEEDREEAGKEECFCTRGVLGREVVGAVGVLANGVPLLLTRFTVAEEEDEWEEEWIESPEDALPLLISQFDTSLQIL